jgi:two-component system, chemotaxis family, chemotaxis protein CheY
VSATERQPDQQKVPEAPGVDPDVKDPERHVDPRARVLVVEDDNDLRELIARWLESRNYIVVEAADGRDAVDLLEAGLEPDVILLDLGLPRMDGREFLAWLRTNPKHADRHVIVASAYLEDAPPVDADRAFQKPFRPDLLERELERLATGE